jgi:hypothetical protein
MSISQDVERFRMFECEAGQRRTPDREMARDGKIEASDACSALRAAKVLSARWVRARLQNDFVRQHTVRRTEERKFFSAVIRGAVVPA